jgi:hypothetical protein
MMPISDHFRPEPLAMLLAESLMLPEVAEARELRGSLPWPDMRLVHEPPR